MALPLVTARLVVRPFVPDDADELHDALYGDAAAMHFLGGVRDVAGTRQSVERYVEHQERRGFSFWAVEERETGYIVGEAGLFPFSGEGPDIELGYAFGHPWWGRGYATEVGEALLREAYDGLGVDRLVAVARRENVASLQVLRKLGFVEHGERHAWGQWQVFHVHDGAR